MMKEIERPTNGQAESIIVEVGEEDETLDLRRESSPRLKSGTVDLRLANAIDIANLTNPSLSRVKIPSPCPLPARPGRGEKKTLIAGVLGS